MNILAIDDEKLALEALTEAVREAMPQAEVHGFRDPAELIACVRARPADVAFLDIEMRNITGIELAKELKTICPAINIIFVTGHARYAIDAFALRASGYLLKPATAEDVKREIEQLRYQASAVPANRLRLRVQTFGNFEVFLDDKPLYFKRAKAKEMFAYLIDRRGASCTMAEIAGVLWEDQVYSRSQLNQIHIFIGELKRAFGAVGERDVLIKQHNSLAVNIDKVDCDYYRFLKSDVGTINSFGGEYMSNYSWAEFTVGGLVSKKPAEEKNPESAAPWTSA